MEPVLGMVGNIPSAFPPAIAAVAKQKILLSKILGIKTADTNLESTAGVNFSEITGPLKMMRSSSPESAKSRSD